MSRRVVEIRQVDGLMRPEVRLWAHRVGGVVQALPIKRVSATGQGIAYMVGPFSDGVVLISSTVILHWLRVDWGRTHWGGKRPTSIDLLTEYLSHD